ncbi:fumarylacetoacetate hydrolase family protein [Variovorax sp. J31P207]|uniref:fumarylacetoacetate hydrolase family protein n=1 Tax=Variovorax sp. J31P207 TaxID=3053510 RepID=UPI002577E30B|nr:fumarylacetoacetate hydrolase family protein [Variovorax sp. J31P207]MDM0071536.1 fumarylacetoacetate hydrolase family protein [Variovorax sp. J31P207]
MIRTDVAPYGLSGTVYVALLNHRQQWMLLDDEAHRAPYKAPARAPVLAVKPRNTFCATGGTVAAPAQERALRVGASLAIVIGRTACRVSVSDALDHVAGYAAVVDLSAPHESHYRPSVRLKARDGSCVFGSRIVPASAVAHPDALSVRIRVGGQAPQASDTGDRVRGVAQLISDVTEFMTLHPGDLLLLGESAGAPVARPGERVEVEIEGVGSVHFEVVSEDDGGAA